VRYSDVIINPTHWPTWTGTMDQLFDALAAGFAEAAQDGLCRVQMCLSLLRTQSASEANETVAWMIENRPAGVVGLSVDGNEAESGRTGEKFAAAFTAARDAGIRRTVHAGESSGPEGVWDAVRLLHAERIDHGVRAIEDPELVEYLVDHAIPLNVCPRSNLTLGIYPDLVSHPVAELRSRGVTVTINTDDPAPIGTRIEQEWSLCADYYGWGFPDMITLAQASIEASFAPDDFKAELLGELATFK
jgi:adenosine deaminase